MTSPPPRLSPGVLAFASTLASKGDTELSFVATYFVVPIGYTEHNAARQGASRTIGVYHMHALESGSAGQVAFAGRGEPAWHMLGTIFDKDADVSTREMLDLAYLSGWNVRLLDLALASGDAATWVQEAYAVVRDNPFGLGLDVLATVGGRYKVVQNEDLFAFGDALLDGGGRWETAGSIRDGRVVFGSLAIDREMVIGAGSADDKVNTYLLVTTSHDGTVGVQAATTPVRVVCQNTLNLALRGVKQSFKMRHTSTIDGRVAAAREALALTFTYADAFEAEAEALYQTSVTNGEFLNIVTSLYPKPEDASKAALTRWENKVGLLGDLFVGAADAGGVEGAPVTGLNIAGTAWGALNALTERLDWYRTPRKGDVANVAEAASGFSPIVNAEKQKIRSAVLSFAADKGAAVRV